MTILRSSYTGLYPQNHRFPCIPTAFSLGNPDEKNSGRCNDRLTSDALPHLWQTEHSPPLSRNHCSRNHCLYLVASRSLALSLSLPACPVESALAHRKGV